MAERDLVRTGLLLFGITGLVLAGLQVAAPGTFFEEIGPFGERNDHYIRDSATFAAALGVVLLAAVGRPSWRVPALLGAAVQYSLHAVNHLADIGEADPKAVGVVDFILLALGAATLAWLTNRAAQEARAPGVAEP